MSNDYQYILHSYKLKDNNLESIIITNVSNNRDKFNTPIADHTITPIFFFNEITECETIFNKINTTAPIDLKLTIYGATNIFEDEEKNKIVSSLNIYHKKSFYTEIFTHLTKQDIKEHTEKNILKLKALKKLEIYYANKHLLNNEDYEEINKLNVSAIKI